MWPKFSEQVAKWNDMRMGKEGKRRAIPSEPTGHRRIWHFTMMVGDYCSSLNSGVMISFTC
jgi:hypothetical protein